MIKLLCCISFDSYIKPQPSVRVQLQMVVVYLLIPTSNHNRRDNHIFHAAVVYLLIPTSNHNYVPRNIKSKRLYIFWFLHQTTTIGLNNCFLICCISFDSYIKPQPSNRQPGAHEVVYLLIPTSNHNSDESYCNLQTVVYLLIPTSNHNDSLQALIKPYVVYLLIPTSNHNRPWILSNQ